MESRKTFGAYICQRRRELGMTQKEFAQRLFVTDSAVSKWERGLSYPDITLLKSICGVLEISEYELLNGSEDTQRRNSERLADKYLRLTRSVRVAQYIVYGLILLGCAIGNLVGGHGLDWFFIALASVLVAASLTLVPALSALRPRLDRYKGPLTLACFTASLEFLLLACCLYGGGDWFGVAGIAVLFGIVLVALPFVLPRLPLPAWMAERKASAYLVMETALLLILLLVCCLHGGGDWFIVAAVSVVFGLGFFVLPVLLRQGLRRPPLCRHKLAIYLGVQTALLLALLAVADAYTGADALLTLSLPIAFIGLTLPWGVALAARYLPLNGWLRASACTAWSVLWLWIAPLGLDRVMTARYGASGQPYRLNLPFDLLNWDVKHVAWNVMAIVLLALVAISAALAIRGLRRAKDRAEARRAPDSPE